MPTTHTYDDEIGTLQAASLRARYLDGSLRAADMVRAVYDRIEARDDDHVWIDLVPRAAAIARAQRLDRALASGTTPPPLFGLPFAVKDNIDIAGHLTTAGCPGFAYRARTSAPTVDRILAAGGVLIGKTNLDQFATGLVGTRSPYGIPVSPFNADMIAGGSSSGSGVAVAAGLVTFALGTDTAGSGRVPAAFGNVVGIKPSRGLVSTRGVVPACRSLDCVSVFALSVRDAQTVLDVMSGPDPDDPYSRSLPTPPRDRATAERGLSGVKLAVPVPEQLDFLGDVGAEAGFAAARQRLTALGAKLVGVDISGPLEAGRMLYGGPWLAERYTVVAAFLRDRPEEVHPVIQQILAGAAAITGADVFTGLHRLREIAHDLRRLWADRTALVLPTVPTSYRVQDVLADPVETNTRLGRYTTFANPLDLAAVAVPAGFTSAGLPHGVTFFGPAGTDATLAALAAAFHADSGPRVGATPHALI